MKKIVVYLALVLMLTMMLSLVCFATETEAVGLDFSENEQAIADSLNGVLQKGDELFEDQPWWTSFSSMVRENMPVIVTSLAGAIAFVGSILLWKSRTKIREYIDAFKESVKKWLSSLNTKANEIKTVVDESKESMANIKQELISMRNTTALLIDALEDIIKLSGADEGKKDLYIMNIEKAKSELKDEK